MTRKDPMTIRFTEQEEPIVTRAAEPAVRAKRVLLAEDDAEMRGLLAAALRLDHYEVWKPATGVSSSNASRLHASRDCRWT